MRVLFLSVFTILLIPSITLADNSFKTEKYTIIAERLVDGLQHPWAIEFLPDGSMLVSERPGYLRKVKQGVVSKPIKGLPKLRAFGQGGLLDIALDPNFESNQLIYLSYAGVNEDGVGTEVVKARLQDNRLEDATVIFSLNFKNESGYHFGSRLQFDKQGDLYISLGDRGEMDRAQDLSDHAGSLIRVKADGSIPTDNPFINKQGAQPEIYTWGNRNMQGMAMHPDSGAIWTVEHGPQGGDELNLMQAGKNYGWPVITYGKNYGTGTDIGEGTEKAGMEQPVHYWVPSIATSSLLFYDGEQFSDWQGNAFVGSLKFGQLARLEMKGNKVVHEERLLNGKLGRIRDVKQGPDGLIYVITDEQNGAIYRLKPAS